MAAPRAAGFGGCPFLCRRRQSRRLVEQIEEGMLQLFRHPNLGRAGRVPGTRELVIAGTPFLVVYRLEADRAVVLTVLHGARRWPR